MQWLQLQLCYNKTDERENILAELYSVKLYFNLLFKYFLLLKAIEMKS